MDHKEANTLTTMMNSIEGLIDAALGRSKTKQVYTAGLTLYILWPCGEPFFSNKYLYWNSFDLDYILHWTVHQDDQQIDSNIPNNELFSAFALIETSVY